MNDRHELKRKRKLSDESKNEREKKLITNKNKYLEDKSEERQKILTKLT